MKEPASATSLDDGDRRSYEQAMTSDHHSRGGIVHLLDIPNDVFTVWLRQGLIVPIEAAIGRGKALRFDRYQLRIAACLANARDVGLNGEALRVIANTLQSAVKVFDRANLEPSLLTSMLEERGRPGFLAGRLDVARGIVANAMNRGKLDVAEHYRAWIGEIGAEDPAQVDTIRAAVSLFTDDDLDALWLCVQLFESEGYLMVYWDRTRGGWKAKREPELSGALPAGACVLIDFASLKGLPV